jgi:organic hydroperoxide reductase OsmC/OhrA
MDHQHHYALTNTWTGNKGTGTSDYRSYGRDHEIHADGKVIALPGSADKTFRGDPARYNPEELLVAALSSCHLLSFLHLCADNGIVVTKYTDSATGTMATHPDGSGDFTLVTLRPHVTITDAARMGEVADLHTRAHHLCFIARSVNFPVEVEPVTVS